MKRSGIRWVKVDGGEISGNVKYRGGPRLILKQTNSGSGEDARGILIDRRYPEGMGLVEVSFEQLKDDLESYFVLDYQQYLADIRYEVRHFRDKSVAPIEPTRKRSKAMA